MTPDPVDDDELARRGRGQSPLERSLAESRAWRAAQTVETMPFEAFGTYWELPTKPSPAFMVNWILPGLEGGPEARRPPQNLPEMMDLARQMLPEDVLEAWVEVTPDGSHLISAVARYFVALVDSVKADRIALASARNRRAKRPKNRRRK